MDVLEVCTSVRNMPSLTYMYDKHSDMLVQVLCLIPSQEKQLKYVYRQLKWNWYQGLLDQRTDSSYM